MVIRSAQESDLDALTMLNQQIGQIHFDQMPEAFDAPSAADRQFLVNVLKNNTHRFFVAQRGQQVIGFITATITQNETIPFLVKFPICRIGSIVVDEHHRSRGVGRALMNAVHQWAREQGAKQVRLEVMAFNHKAHQFYTTLGFSQHSFIMAKPLD
ncbi:GNAT family N-acetyltransferase [Celerinatantimonas yamalensis]|uniref:GNAT family N-acetyltransferase n=1 Tax=Celerinatantimonas yamalensis TaxID=559956 RepID=A0ABW9G7Y7_9GAMM